MYRHTKILMAGLGLLLLFAGWLPPAQAQSIKNQNVTRISVKITAVYAGAEKEAIGRNEYRYKVWWGSGLRINCIQKKGGKGWFSETAP